MSALPPKADIGVSLKDLRFSKIGSCASFLGRRCPNISTHRRSIIVRRAGRLWPSQHSRGEFRKPPLLTSAIVLNGCLNLARPFEIHGDGDVMEGAST